MPLIDFIGTIVLTGVMIVNVNAVISTLAVSRAQRLGLAAGVGLWIGLQVALASAGAYRAGIPYIGISAAAPLVAALIAVRYAEGFRHALLAAPTSLLVGLNVNRIFGVFFLLLAAAGRLGGPFPQSAGWGDVLVGALALPLAIMIARGRARRGGIVAWNVFGMVDLLAAVGLGLLSAPGSPVQVIDAGVGSSAVTALPWVLIPTVLVPFYLIVHAVVFAQVRMTGTVSASA